VSRRVSFRPEAEAEALETRDWYEGRRPGLGAEFRAALDETIERIADNPTQFRLVRGETRRAILNRFPTPYTSALTATTSLYWPCTDANIRADGNHDGAYYLKDS
jgi:plasmid stabilization system protein ParE